MAENDFMAGFLDQIEPLKQAALAELDGAADLAALEQARVNYLGANGRFTALMKQLGTLPREEKPAAGKAINGAKVELEAALARRRGELELKAALPAEPTIAALLECEVNDLYDDETLRAASEAARAAVAAKGAADARALAAGK